MLYASTIVREEAKRSRNWSNKAVFVAFQSLVAFRLGGGGLFGPFALPGYAYDCTTGTSKRQQSKVVSIEIKFNQTSQKKIFLSRNLLNQKKNRPLCTASFFNS